MKNKIVHVLCEGQTEQGFVEEVLKPYLLDNGVTSVKSILISTNTKKGTAGGMYSFSQVHNNLDIIKKSYIDNEYERHIFTTMFDYYELPASFPEYDKSKNITDKYKNFSDFKRYVIEPAIKDINEHSTMKVSYETDGTRGKKVSEITFTCVDNFILPNADEKVKKAFEELIFYKINKNVALDIVKKYSFERIENNIQYILTNYPKKNRKKDYPGLIIAAIKENFAGKSWGLESIDDEDVQKDKEQNEKYSRDYDEYIKKIKTDEDAEKIIKTVLEKTESTLLLNQLNALIKNYEPLELLNHKLFKSIVVPIMKNENLF